MAEHEFTVLHLFGGIGGGAIGFASAAARFGGHVARFRTAGSVDFDELANRDFEYLADAPALTADLHTLTPAELLRFCPQAPDAVLMSPPCKGFSGLLSAKRAGEEKYQKLNRLLLEGLFLLCSTWDAPPPLIFVENVPRIVSRGQDVLASARAILTSHGYAVTPDGSHNCGELGGLAQNRQRFFMVARCRKRIPQFVYQPPKQRVRACGEVLGPLPIPGDVASAGPLHSLPRISWRNWVRLALIPAGGDWRDLPGVVPAGKTRREVHRRAAVADWKDPAAAVVGPGGAGAENVADPRIAVGPRFDHCQRVMGWDDTAGTVTAATHPSNGAPSVADPRVGAFGNVDRVTHWDGPVGTVTSSPAPSSGGGAVADPRVTGAGADTFKGRPGLFGVTDWRQPAPTVTGSAKVSGSNAPAAVADPRAWFAGTLGITEWDEPSGTVTGQARPVCGKFSVADPRLGCAPRAGAYRVLSWEEAAATITGSLNVDNGAAAVADPRPVGATLAGEHLDPDKPPPFTPVIIAADGTWHRPLTTLELAALQGLPLWHKGAPLILAGSGHTRWREAIGNAIPPPAAEAIAEQLLLALLVSKLGGFSLSTNEIWVTPREVLVA